MTLSAVSVDRSRGTLPFPAPSLLSLPKLIPLLRRVIGRALQFVPIDAPRPTEGADPACVDRLRNKIEADDYLDEPLDTVEKGPLVNGHTRDGALHLLDSRDVLVLDHSIADLTCATWSILNRYPAISANRWPEPFIEMPLEDFLRARSTLFFATCIVSLEDGICRIFPEQATLKESLSRQNDVYQVFAQTTNGLPIDRIADDELPPFLHQWRQEYGVQSQMLLYPHFLPEQILDVAEGGLKVAPGATRFGFPFRVKNLKVPLRLLRSTETTETKNRRLQAVLRAHPLVSLDGETFVPQNLHPGAWEV